MTPKERKAAVTAMAASMTWNRLTHDDVSPSDDAEAALAGLEQFMNDYQMVFYKP